MPLRTEKMAGDRKGKDDSRKNRRKQKKISPVQVLFDTCSEIFADCGPGIVPSPTNIERLKAVMDNMTEADVGLRPNMPCFIARPTEGYPIITYLHMYECAKFSIGIFCLPPQGVIPLHNHPGMTVFSKLLFGTMHITSYDWVEGVDGGSSSTTANVGSSNANAVEPAGEGETSSAPANTAEAGVRLAKLKVDTNFTAPCDTSILYPNDGGNLHCFTALTACAVLDVLGPPYCDPEGRHCAYYHDYRFNDFTVDGLSVAEEDEKGYAWLREREKPEGLSIVGVRYRGPTWDR